MEGAALVRRLEQRWALDAVEFAVELAARDPTWGTETFPFAGGHAVLCGPGMYVNRAMAAGFDAPLDDDDLELLERRSATVGVPAAIDAGPVSAAGTAARLLAHGYVADGETAAMVRRLDDLSLGAVRTPPPGIVIERADGDLLGMWQEATAVGWGHVDPVARRVSDTFAGIAAAVDEEGFVIARDTADGRALGSASLTIRDGIATLGGMSTVPAERRRGVQSALIVHRLRMARAAGCELAAVTAVVGSDSERNLLRHGFTRTHVTTTYVRRVV